MFKTAGVPIYGIGLQSHIKSADLDITSMKVGLSNINSVALDQNGDYLTICNSKHIVLNSVRNQTEANVMAIDRLGSFI